MRFAVAGLPWASNLTVNTYYMGPGGHFRRPRQTQDWMEAAVGLIAMAYREAAGEQGELRAARIQHEDVKDIDDHQVVVHITYRWPDRHRRDKHNYEKPLMDAMQKATGVNDSFMIPLHGPATIDHDNPGFDLVASDDVRLVPIPRIAYHRCLAQIGGPFLAGEHIGRLLEAEETP